MNLQIKEYRIEREMTLTELAKITGLSKGYLSKLENGKTNPTIKTIKIIAHTLETCPKKLIDSCEEIENCDKCSYK